MRLVLLGPPGAGKGTQSGLISQRFSIPQISTGDILRTVAKDDASQIGAEVRAIMQRGLLVPDDLIIEIVKGRLERSDCQAGYLLDGIPRTIKQAKALAKSDVHFDVVIELCVPDQMVVERLGGRLIHPASGRTYHVKYNPPRVPNRDDVTGDPLVQRDDDSVATVLKRLVVYHQHNREIVQFYRDCYDRDSSPFLLCIDGLDDVDSIFHKIVGVLESIGLA